MFFWLARDINWHDRLSFVYGAPKASPKDIHAILLLIGAMVAALVGLSGFFLLLTRTKLSFPYLHFQVFKPMIIRLAIKIMLIIVFVVSPMFHRSFLMPDALKNKAYIGEQITLKNPKIFSWHIAYFNDKFVFIAIEDSSKEKLIEVMEFNAMFSASDR